MQKLIKIILTLLSIGIVIVLNAAQSNQTAVADDQFITNTSTSVYLPFIANQYDSSLGIPVFGVQMYGSTQSSRSYYPFLVDSEASWVRAFVSWEAVEPVNVSPTSFKWSSVDSSLAAARTDNGQFHLVVTIGDNPSWSADSSNGVIYPDKMDDFAEFVAALVERYDGDGVDDAPGSPVVLYWELYNEPDSNDTQVEFRWGNDGDKYAAMLAEVYPTAKSANPQAQVVLGGLAFDWFEEHGGPFVRNFLDDVLAAGGGDNFDVMNFHYYPSFAPNWTSDSSLGLYEKANEIRSILANYGFVKPLILTEAGWHDNDDPGAPSTPAIQSRYIVQLFTESMASDIDLMIWWMLYDAGGFYPYNTGLVTNDASLPIQKKPAFTVYQNTVAELKTAHFVRALSVSEKGNSDLDAYLFQDNVNGRSLYVTWLNPINTTAIHSLHLPTPTATVRNSRTNDTYTVYDSQDGKTDGFVLIQVGNDPLYVEVDN